MSYYYRKMIEAQTARNLMLPIMLARQGGQITEEEYRGRMAQAVQKLKEMKVYRGRTQ